MLPIIMLVHNKYTDHEYTHTARPSFFFTTCCSVYFRYFSGYVRVAVAMLVYTKFNVLRWLRESVLHIAVHERKHRFQRSLHIYNMHTCKVIIYKPFQSSCLRSCTCSDDAKNAFSQSPQYIHKNFVTLTWRPRHVITTPTTRGLFVAGRTTNPQLHWTVINMDNGVHVVPLETDLCALAHKFMCRDKLFVCVCVCLCKASI